MAKEGETKVEKRKRKHSDEKRKHKDADAKRDAKRAKRDAKQEAGDSDDDEVVVVEAPAPAPASSSSAAVPPARKYVVGIDVGIKNVGVCVSDFAAGTHKLFLVDMWLLKDTNGEWRNVDAEERLVYDAVLKFVDDFGPFFQNAKRVGIEKQMQRKMVLIGHVMQVVICERFPHLSNTCLTVSPKFTRKHLDSVLGLRLSDQAASLPHAAPGDKKAAQARAEAVYRINKQASVDAVKRLFGEAKFDAVQKLFSKRDKKGNLQKKVDAFEAFLIALCLEKCWADALKTDRKKPTLLKGVARNTIPIRAIEVHAKL